MRFLIAKETMLSCWGLGSMLASPWEHVLQKSWREPGQKSQPSCGRGLMFCCALLFYAFASRVLLCSPRSKR
eukprot:8131508-Heterocapsa_arctica.AAC.1